MNPIDRKEAAYVLMYIGGSSGNLERIRATLREAPLVALRQQLTDRDILDACRSCDYRFRRRQYDPVVTVFHFLAQAIQREQSFAATWQELWTPVAAAFRFGNTFGGGPAAPPRSLHWTHPERPCEELMHAGNMVARNRHPAAGR